MSSCSICQGFCSPLLSSLGVEGTLCSLELPRKLRVPGPEVSVAAGPGLFLLGCLTLTSSEKLLSVYVLFLNFGLGPHS